MSIAELYEHQSASYAPRTRANASNADLTVAFAVDFSTAGERLTHKAAQDRYLGIALRVEPLAAARQLFREMRRLKAHSLNIAGNGIYTLALGGWQQSEVDLWVYQVLAQVHTHWPISSVRSGGQKGVDLAGLVSAHALSIPYTGLLPKGFLQRDTDKIDRRHTASEIRHQIASGVDALLREIADLAQT